MRAALAVAPARDAPESPGRHVQHMQKALTQMNIQLTNVISDVVGETVRRYCAPSSPASVMDRCWRR